MPSSRWSTPSTGTPIDSTAARTSAAWRGEPALLRITPAIRTAGSKVRIPCTIAAIDRDADDTSTTSTTGEAVTAATWAVEAKPSRPSWPSYRPITPSMTATSAPAAP